MAKYKQKSMTKKSSGVKSKSYAKVYKKKKKIKKKIKKIKKKDSPEMGNEPKDGVIYQGRYKEILPKTGVNQPETVRNRMKKKKY